MRKYIIALALSGNNFFISAQLPTIHSPTIIPAKPTGSSQVKIVTHLETPNSAFLVDKQFTVTAPSQSVKLHLCYADGMSTVISHHIDTFAVGQMPQGIYLVQLNAYMSGAGQHCARVDSNFATFTFTVGGTVGLGERNTANKFKIFPNPAHDYINIEPATSTTVRIFSLLGQVVLAGESSPSGTISVQGLPAGIYLLETGSDKGKDIHKVVIR
jgi:hypothetical protein